MTTYVLQAGHDTSVCMRVRYFTPSLPTPSPQTVPSGNVLGTGAVGDNLHCARRVDLRMGDAESEDESEVDGADGVA